MLNEYSFECSVFDECGEDASGYIRIFPERYSDGRKPSLMLAVRILHWNKHALNTPDVPVENLAETEPKFDLPLAKCDSVAIDHYSGEVDIPVDKTVPAVCFNMLEYNEFGGGWVISDSPEKFSGTGKISFYRGDKLERTFYYTVNFFKKIVLEYTYKTNGRNAAIFTFKRAPKTDIPLLLMAADGVPCLKSDIVGSAALLKAGERTAVFGTDVANKRLRVAFGRDEDAKFYLLRDGMGGRIGARLSDDKTRVVRCPFCLRPIKITKQSVALQRKGRAVGCDGERIDAVIKDKRRGRICCSFDSKSLPSEASHADYLHTKLRQYKPLWGGSRAPFSLSDKEALKNILLPPDYERGNGIIASVIGGAGAGKSVFISRLAGIFSCRDEKPAHMNGVPWYLRTTLKGFFDKASYYMPEVDYSPASDREETWCRIFGTDDSGVAHYGKAFGYAMSAYDDMVKPHAKSDTEVLQRMPFIIRLDKRSEITLFDVPGALKHAVKSHSWHAPSVKFSDCLILLVNIDSSPLHNGSPTKSADNIAQASEMLESIVGELGNGSSEITDRALAVVLCKLDLVDDTIDVNSAVLSADLFDGGGKYKGSRLQSNIDAASDEVERIIATSKDANGLFKNVNRFKYRKYFAISALGDPECVTIDKSKSRILYETSPRRLEHVVQWLLWQTGIIE